MTPFNNPTDLHKLIISCVFTVIKKPFYVSLDLALLQLSTLTWESFLLAY